MKSIMALTAAFLMNLLVLLPAHAAYYGYSEILWKGGAPYLGIMAIGPENWSNARIRDGVTEARSRTALDMTQRVLAGEAGQGWIWHEPDDAKGGSTTFMGVFHKATDNERTVRVITWVKFNKAVTNDELSAAIQWQHPLNITLKLGATGFVAGTVVAEETLDGKTTLYAPSWYGDHTLDTRWMHEIGQIDRSPHPTAPEVEAFTFTPPGDR